MDSAKLERIDAVVEAILKSARIPGAALAVVVGGEAVFAKGYGYRDLEGRLPVTANTVYPIASTTKAFNTTLIGMLVDEGRISWDAPVQDYLPRFHLRDPLLSTQVTIRDLVTMRTGLPRHDWLWIDRSIDRAELVECMRHLKLSSGFRERFQYNNLTVTIAGHVVEVVTGQTWEEQVQRRILDPLQMNSTGFAPSAHGDATLSYHENSRRELTATREFDSRVIAPAGGAIHSTVIDMMKWISFNLNGGTANGLFLIKPETLAEIQSPLLFVGSDPTAPTCKAAYALGWFVDTYNGRSRVSHGGYLRDVNSDVSLFPEDGIGLVSFTNFGNARLAAILTQNTFDILMGLRSSQTPEERLAQYEKKIVEARHRIVSVHRVDGTTPSHSPSEYKGIYAHPGYGTIELSFSGSELQLKRESLVIPLQHWHYDTWIPQDSDMFAIDVPHPFDRASRVTFETNDDGEISAMSIRFEPAVPRIRFQKTRGAA